MLVREHYGFFLNKNIDFTNKTTLYHQWLDNSESNTDCSYGIITIQ